MADDVGGISVSFTAEASQLQSEMRRLEERLRAFDRAHGQQRVKINADFQQPGDRRMSEYRRDIQKSVNATPIKAQVQLAAPNSSAVNAFRTQLQAMLNAKPIMVRVQPLIDGRGAGGGVAGGGGGGVGGGGGDAGVVPTAPRLGGTVKTARQEADLRAQRRDAERSAKTEAERPTVAAVPPAIGKTTAGAIAGGATSGTKQAAVSTGLTSSSNAARAAAQVKPVSNTKFFADWSNEDLLGERGTGKPQYRQKVESEIQRRGITPGGGQRGFLGDEDPYRSSLREERRRSMREANAIRLAPTSAPRLRGRPAPAGESIDDRNARIRNELYGPLGGQRGFMAGDPAAGAGRGEAVPHWSRMDPNKTVPSVAATVTKWGNAGLLTRPAEKLYDAHGPDISGGGQIGVEEARGVGKFAGRGLNVGELERNLLGVFQTAGKAQIEAGQNWYRDAGNLMERLAEGTGLSRTQAVSAGAVFSSNADWAQNIRNAQDFFGALQNGASSLEEVNQHIQSVRGGKNATTGPITEKAWRVANTPDDQIDQLLANYSAKTGASAGHDNPKLRAFAKALLGDEESFTVDRHMARMMSGREVVTDQRAHGVFQTAGQQAAKKAGISPAALQAITWVSALGNEIAGADPYGMQSGKGVDPIYAHLANQFRGTTETAARASMEPRVRTPAASGVSAPAIAAAPMAAGARGFMDPTSRGMLRHPSENIDPVTGTPTMAALTRAGRHTERELTEPEYEARFQRQLAARGQAHQAHQLARMPAQMHSRLQQTWGGYSVDPTTGEFVEPEPGRTSGPYISGQGETVTLPLNANPAQLAAGRQELSARNPLLAARAAQGLLLEGGFRNEDDRQLELNYAKRDETLSGAYRTQLALGEAGGGAYNVGGGPDAPGVFAPGNALGRPATHVPAMGQGRWADTRRFASKADLTAAQSHRLAQPPVGGESLEVPSFMRGFGSAGGGGAGAPPPAPPSGPPGEPPDDEGGPISIDELERREARWAPARASGPARTDTAAGPATFSGATGGGISPIRQQARMMVREAGTAENVRGLGTMIGQQAATFLGGRAGRQEQAAAIGATESALGRAEAGAKGASEEIADLTAKLDDLDPAAEGNAKTIAKYGRQLDDAKEKAREFTEEAKQLEGQLHDQMAGYNAQGSALKNLGIGFVGAMGGMVAFQVGMGAITAIGERLAPVLAEGAERAGGFQINSNRLRESLAGSTQEMNGFAETALAASYAQSGLSAATFDLVKGIVAEDALFEASNKNLEKRIDLFRAHQGIQTRAGGISGMAGEFPAGLTQTQGGMNIFGLQTPIGGTPSFFEQMGRQMQFGTTPQIDPGDALGAAGVDLNGVRNTIRGVFGGEPIPEQGPGNRPFDIGRDVTDPFRGRVWQGAQRVLSAGGLIDNPASDFAGGMRDEFADRIDAANGLGPLNDAAKAGANILRTDFNDAVERAGGSTMRLAQVNEKNAGQMEAQAAQIDALLNSGDASLAQFAEGMLRSKTVITGAGEVGTSPREIESFIRRTMEGGEAAARGGAMPDPELLAEQIMKPLAAQVQMLQWQGGMQRDTMIPGQAFLGQLSQGRVDASGSRRSFGSRVLPEGAAEEFGVDTSGLVSAQQGTEAVAQQGASALRGLMREADAMSGASSGPRSMLSQFDALTEAASATAGQIRAINRESAQLQMGLQLKQIAEQIRVTGQSLADAQSFISGEPSAGPGGGELGVLQHRARLYDQQSAAIGFQQQALSLQSQSLGLQNAQLGIRSRELGFQTTQLQFQSRELGFQATAMQLAQRQRQINFQQAVAGFVTPGATAEEIGARQQEAQLEAEFAQKQHDIASQQFGIEKEVFELEKQQLPIAEAQLAIDKEQVGLQAQQLALAGQALQVAQAAFANQQAMIDVSAARAVETLTNQLALLQEQARVTVQVQVNAEAVEEYQAQLSAQMEAISSLVSEAYGITNAFASAAAAQAAAVGGFMTVHMKTLVDKYGQYLRDINATTRANTPGSRTGGGAGGGQQFRASGMFQNVAGATQITVGEAGPETVAILRNPRTHTLPPQNGGGGGGGGTTNINISVSGGGQDPDALAAVIARKVEEAMSRRNSLLGMRMN